MTMMTKTGLWHKEAFCRAPDILSEWNLENEGLPLVLWRGRLDSCFAYDRE